MRWDGNGNGNAVVEKDFRAALGRVGALGTRDRKFVSESTRARKDSLLVGGEEGNRGRDR